MSYKRQFYNTDSDLSQVTDSEILKKYQTSRCSRNIIEESPDLLLHLSISKLTGNTSNIPNTNRKELSLLKSVLIINAMKKLEGNYNYNVPEQKSEPFGCEENTNIFQYDRKISNDIKNNDWLFSEYNRVNDNSKISSTNTTDLSFLDCYNSINSFNMNNNSPQNDFLWNQLISGIESFVNEFNNLNNKKLDYLSINGSCGNKLSTFNIHSKNDEKINGIFLPQIENNHICDYTLFSISPTEHMNNDDLYSSPYSFSQSTESILPEFNMDNNNNNNINNINNSIELCPNSHNYSLVTCGDSSVSLNFVNNGT